MTTPAPAVWSDGDPLMAAIAAAVSEQCATHPEQGLTVDDPRTIAAVAATVARQVLGTPAEAHRNEIRQSYTALSAQAEADRDHEGAFSLACQLRDREEQWRQEDEQARQVLGTPTTEPAPTLEPQDHPGADLFVALQAAGLDADEANRRMYAYAAMVLRQEKAITSAPAATADRATVLREAWDLAHEEGSRLEEVAGIEAARGARCVAHLLRRLANEAQPETATRGGSYLTAEHDTLGMIAARYGGDLFAWERANPWVTDTSMPLPTGLRVAIPADEAESTDTEDDDTLHTCPGRWGGPDCRCFDPEPATAATEEPQP